MVASTEAGFKAIEGGGEGGVKEASQTISEKVSSLHKQNKRPLMFRLLLFPNSFLTKTKPPFFSFHCTHHVRSNMP